MVSAYVLFQVAGDMLCQDAKFDVSQVLAYFKRKCDGSLALLYDLEPEERTETRGIVEMDATTNRLYLAATLT